MVSTEEKTLMRIYLGELDRCGHRPLYQVVMELFMREGLAGATVFKGAMGYGAHNELHSGHLLRLSGDLPVVVEVIDRQERIDAVLPKLEGLVRGGIITLQNIRTVHFSR
ncbi:MAG: hypothetical protein C0614_03470 [Desulfuromonas sp.]|nr:MAG: hypothetical protein C0614_03470 [Desulfuromonas sp.]